MRIIPTYKHMFSHIFDVKLFKTLPHDQYFWGWFVDINGEWLDSRNLIIGVPIDLNGGYDTLKKFKV